MNRISVWQMACLFALMLLGNSIIMGVGDQALNSSWLAVLIAMLAAIPLLLISSRLVKLFPNMSIYQIVVLIFGKAGGMICSGIFVWYCVELGALVIRNITEFIQIVTIMDTSQYVFAVAVLLLSIWCAKSGLHVMARCALYGIPAIVLITVATAAAGIKDMHFWRLLPLIGVEWRQFAAASCVVFAFPFMETITLSSQAYMINVKKGQSIYKATVIGVLLGGMLLMFITMRNILMMSNAVRTYTIFSSYSAVGILSVGEFFTRFEAMITASLLLAAFMKLSVCLIVAAKGVTGILGIQDYRDAVVPISLMMLFMGSGLMKNFQHLIEFIYIYPYYAFPVQVLVPVITWIAAEVKAKKIKKQGIDPFAVLSRKLGPQRARPLPPE